MKGLRMETTENKIFFSPGDIVTIRQDIPNKPIMIVVKKISTLLKHEGDKEGLLRGIRCRWFTKDGYIQEEIFNTKDLELVK